MPNFKICYKAADKDVKVKRSSDTTPSGYTLLNTINHTASNSDVIYHHVRDEMYKLGILDMRGITISLFDEVTNVTDISISPASVTKAPTETQQLTVTFTPTNPDNQTVIFTSSNEAFATVDEDGLITAVADGVATITGTSVDGGFTDTCVVTVTTP